MVNLRRTGDKARTGSGDRGLKRVLNWLLAIAGGYLGLVVLVYLLQDRMIFYPTGAAPAPLPMLGADDREISLDANGHKLHGWQINAGRSKVILYYGGNAEAVYANISDFHHLTDTTFLLMNYRGYGRSSGRPGQEALFADALAVYDQLVAQNRDRYRQVVLMGRSLGSGVAVYVASQRKVDGLILITPFDSLRTVAKRSYFFLPVDWLMRHPFDSYRYAADLTAPVLVVRAEHDQVVPPSSTRRLMDFLPDATPQVVIPDAGHNDLHISMLYWSAIRGFLNNARPAVTVKQDDK